MINIQDGNRIIIAISGKQLSGKDTLAKILISKMPYFKRVGLADAIKKEYANQKGISVEQIENEKHLYRQELIELGNYGRTLDDGYFWINKVLEEQGNIIVPDIRVQKEFYAFKNDGSVMIRIESDRTYRANRGNIASEHDKTESDLDNITEWDFIVANNNDLAQLEQQAENICEKINSMISSCKK